MIVGQDNSILLQEAIDAYSNEDYPQTIDIYEQILSNEWDAFEVYFNLGNAYFKDDHIGHAILNYERAGRINPSDADLQHNLAMAQARTVDKIEILPVPEFVSGVKSFINSTSADRWGMLSIAAFFLMLLSVILFLFSYQRWIKQVLLGTGILSAMLMLVFLFFGWQQTRWLNSSKEAIIFQPSITVSSTPNSSGEELFVLHEGTKVRVLEHFQDWIRIRIGDGNSGWIPLESAEEI